MEIPRLETIDRDNWRDFLELPCAVLVLGKTDCSVCHAWCEELAAHFAAGNPFPKVRFGKLELDRGGLSEFKKENGDWLKGIDDLPCNVIYHHGQQVTSWIGCDWCELESRLTRAGQPTIMKAGWRAACLGLKADVNPYPERSLEAEIWRTGFLKYHGFTRPD